MATDDFKRIFEALRVAVVLADTNGAIQYANSALGELASREGGELAGASLVELFDKEDRKRLQQNLARVGEGKASSAFFDAMLHPDGGSARWVSVALQPALDSRDQAAGVVAILQDIGTQRETDEALNLVSARLLAMAESAPVAMMVETAPGDVEIANDALCRLLGLQTAAQSLSGLPVKEVLERAPGQAAQLERYPIEVDGEPAGAVWTLRGAGKAPTAVKGAAEIALIEKIGEELSIALEGLSAISIRAQQMEFDPHVIAHFQRIRRSTGTAMAAIGDLVDFSRLSGGVQLRTARFGLRAALADLIARVAANAEEQGCRIRLRVEQDVPDTLEGDVERLELILKNLLDNAFALLPGSTVTLQITPEYETESGIQLSFAVGAEVAEGSAHASRALDAGMGVAVARFMVTAMHGSLQVAARVGPDPLYAFTIEFPVGPAPVAHPRVMHPTLATMPVLVVSAEPDQRLHLANVLRGWRMVPLEADNASMAMALLERMREENTPVPLVILSNKLPVQDGFLLGFRIKHHPQLASTLVMMLASEGRPGDAIACRENGISAYMRYPINDRQLHEAIIAVTGASVHAEEAPTLVTRHSLREQRKGATILLVDRSRDSQILAAHILGRMDCSVVVAQDLEEASAALDQDVYDLVLVDTSLAGLDGPDAASALRSRISRTPDAAVLVAVSLDHSPAYREARLAEGFNATVAKPFRKEDLAALLARVRRAANA